MSVSILHRAHHLLGRIHEGLRPLEGALLPTHLADDLAQSIGALSNIDRLADDEAHAILSMAQRALGDLLEWSDFADHLGTCEHSAHDLPAVGAPSLGAGR